MTFQTRYPASTGGPRTYTPTVTAETGLFNGTATATATGEYNEINGYVFYAVTITISAGTLGTAANGLRFSTPTGLDINSGTTNMGSARESQSTGSAGTVSRSSSTTGQIYRYDNASLIAVSRTVNVSGFYKKA